MEIKQEGKTIKKRKAYKLTDFQHEELSKEDILDLPYNSQEMFLISGEPQVRLIDKPHTNQLQSILVLKQNHFNMFSINDSKDAISFDQRSQFCLEKHQRPKVNKKFNFHNFDGSDLLWLVKSQETEPQPDRETKTSLTLLRVNLEEDRPGAVQILEHGLPYIDLSRSLIIYNQINPINLRNRFINTNFVYLTGYHNKKSEEYILPEDFQRFDGLIKNYFGQRRLSSYHLKSFSKGFSARGGCSRTVLKLFGAKSRMIAKDNDWIKTQRKFFLNEYNSRKANRASFQVLNKRELRFEKIDRFFAYLILIQERFISLSVMEIRTRKTMRSTLISSYELFGELWVDPDYRTENYCLLNAFYSDRADTLGLLFLLNSIRHPVSGLKKVWIEIENPFYSKMRRISWISIDAFSSFAVNEKECSVMFRKEDKSKFYFKFIEFKENKKKCTDWYIGKNEVLRSGDLLSGINEVRRLDETRVFLLDKYKVYIMDTREEKLLCSKQYAHIMVNKFLKNVEARKDKLILMDKRNCVFEVFKANQQRIGLEYVGLFDAGIDKFNNAILKGVEGLTQYRTLKNGNLLISYTTTSLAASQGPFNQPYCLNLIETDCRLGRTVTKRKIRFELVSTDEDSFKLGITDSEEIMIISQTDDKVWVKVANLRGRKDEQVLSYFLKEVRKETGKEFGKIKEIYCRRGCLYVETYNNKETNKIIFVLELKRDPKSNNFILKRPTKRLLKLRKSDVIKEHNFEAKELFVACYGSQEFLNPTPVDGSGVEVSLRLYNTQLEVVKRIVLEPFWAHFLGLSSSSECFVTENYIFLKVAFLHMIVIDFVKMRLRVLESKMTRLDWRVWGEGYKVVSWISGKMDLSEDDANLRRRFVYVDLNQEKAETHQGKAFE